MVKIKNANLFRYELQISSAKSFGWCMNLLFFISSELITDIVIFLIQFIIATLAFFIAGRMLSGVNAKFTDALIVALLGLLLQLGIDAAIDFVLVPGLNVLVLYAWDVVGLIATFIVWMILIQYFFDCSFIRGMFIVAIGFVLILLVDLIGGYLLDFIIPIVFPGP
jgi:hypothetical protein